MHLHSGLYIVNACLCSVFLDSRYVVESYLFLIEERSYSKEFAWLLVSYLVIIVRRVRKVAKSYC
jgi:hypothetical protein